MFFSMSQLLDIIDSGVTIKQLNRFIQMDNELYEDEYEKINDVLGKIVGSSYMEFIQYARLNRVFYRF